MPGFNPSVKREGKAHKLDFLMRVFDLEADFKIISSISKQNQNMPVYGGPFCHT
jgi:hypothetical protein